MKLGRSSGKVLKRDGKLCRGCCGGDRVYLARACESDGVCSTPPADLILVIDPSATCADGSVLSETGQETIRYNGWCYTIDTVTIPADQAPPDAPILTGNLGECYGGCRPPSPNPCFPDFRYVAYPKCQTNIVGDTAPSNILLCADNAVTECRSVYIAEADRCYLLDPQLAIFSNEKEGAVENFLDLTETGLTGPQYPNCCQCATENDVSFSSDASGCDRVNVSVPPCGFFNGVDNRLRCCFGGKPGATATVTWTARRYQRRLDRRFISNPSSGDNCFPESGVAVDTEIEIYERSLVATYQWSEAAGDYLLASASGTETITQSSIFREYPSGCNNGETFDQQTNQLDATDAPDLFGFPIFFYDFNNDYDIMECLRPGQAFGSESRDDGAGCVPSGQSAPARVETKVAQADYTCLQGTASMRYQFESYGRASSAFSPPDCLLLFIERELDSSISFSFSNEDCSGLCGIQLRGSEDFF